MKTGRVYDCQKEEKLVDGLQIVQQIDKKWVPWCSVPLKMCIRFYFSTHKTIGESVLYHVSRPDLSNLIKYVEDICCGIVFIDDCIISVIDARKEFSSESYTEFWFELLN
jgi:Holliday junction resolvase RusA-like endonuclease